MVWLWHYARPFFEHFCGLSSTWSCRKIEFCVKSSEFLKKKSLEFRKILSFWLRIYLIKLLENRVFCKKSWVLEKKLAEFWNFSSFCRAEFLRKCSKKRPALCPAALVLVVVYFNWILLALRSRFFPFPFCASSCFLLKRHLWIVSKNKTLKQTQQPSSEIFQVVYLSFLRIPHFFMHIAKCRCIGRNGVVCVPAAFITENGIDVLNQGEYSKIPIFLVKTFTRSLCFALAVHTWSSANYCTGMWNVYRSTSIF